MTLTEWYQLVKEKMQLPVAYDHFTSPPAPPFLTYLDIGSDTFVADGRVYTKSKKIALELYTDKKEVALEERLEDFFEDFQLIWTDQPTAYIESEKMYCHRYEMTI